MSSFRYCVIAALLCIGKANSLTVEEECTVSNYEDVATAAKSCDTLIIKNLVIPAKTTLIINLKDKAKLIFDGNLTHEVADWAGDLIHVTGTNVEVSGTSNHLIDGLGPKHWKGATEPIIVRPKLIRFSLQNSNITDLKLKNCPCNCITLSQCSHVLISNIDIDNHDGYPEVAGTRFARNTDGFDVSDSIDLIVKNSVIVNQDDCVAVNNGSNMIFDNLHCNGSHGFSFSVKRGHVQNVQFINSKIEFSMNAIHVKTHNDGNEGSIRDILYQNIEFKGIDRYAVSVQQNYPNGNPTANIPITNLTLDNVRGSMSGKVGAAYQIICAKGGCSDWHFKNVKVTGAQKSNECQQVPGGIHC